MRKILLVTMLVISVLVSSASLTLAQDKDKTTSEKVANTFLNSFSSQQIKWQGAKASNPIKLRNKNGDIISYLLEIKQGNLQIGYMIVGANDNVSPVLTVGSGVFPADKILAGLQKFKDKEKGSIVNNPEIIFGGPGIYGVKASENKDTKTTTKVIDESGLDITDAFPNFESNPNAKNSWNKLLIPINGSSPLTQAVPSTSIVQPMGASGSGDVNVRSYDQANSQSDVTGCGPAAGAMILNYWDERGYTNIQADSDRTDGINLMNHLFSDMGTTAIGTSQIGWTNGINAHANSHSGYHFSSYTRYYDSSLRETFWSEIKSEINSGRPVGMFFWLGDSPYSYHIVPCRGWFEDYQYGDRMYHVNTLGTDEWQNFDATTGFDLMYVMPAY